MIEYEYKLQGDGRDSWKATEKDAQGNVSNVYMVYENPNKKVDQSRIDIDTLTGEELQKLANRLKPLLK